MPRMRRQTSPLAAVLLLAAGLIASVGVVVASPQSSASAVASATDSPSALPSPSPTVDTIADPSPGAGPSAAPSASPTSAAEVTVIIDSMVYKPATLTVAPGTTVRWVNEDGPVHTVTARDASYNSGVMTTGMEYRRIFDTPGSFEYFCAVHPLMVGEVVVTEAPG
jgi:plastocyanin